MDEQLCSSWQAPQRNDDDLALIDNRNGRPTKQESNRSTDSNRGQQSVRRTGIYAAELHHSVPPHRWCVTFADIVQFEADVFDAWRLGDIPDSSDSPNPTHNDPIFGPNMYQVSECFVKPKTKRVGSTSYALMLHPGGLECQVFVTHGWAEGVFEFCKKIKKAWPRKAENLWCCILANPQNSGAVSELLKNSDVLQSPFALALCTAEYMVVLPNHKCSIYTRLWCVLEAKLAMEQELTIILPTPVPVRKLFVFMAPGAAIGALAIVSSAKWAVAGYPLNFHGYCEIVSVLVSLLVLTVNRVCGHWENVFVRSCAQEAIIGTFLGIGLCTEFIGEFERNWAQVRKAHFNEHLPFEWLSLIIVLTALKVHVFAAVRNLMIKCEGLQLSYTSVRDAECTSLEDETRIRAAIHNQEDAIDHMIDVLVRTGFYNQAVHEDASLGFDPSLGFRFSFMKLLATSCTLADSLTCGYSSPFRALFYHTRWLFYAVFVLLVPLACCLARTQMPRNRRATFTLTWSWRAVLFLVAMVHAVCPHFKLWVLRNFLQSAVPLLIPLFVLIAPNSSHLRYRQRSASVIMACVCLVGCFTFLPLLFVKYACESYQTCMHQTCISRGSDIMDCAKACRWRNLDQIVHPSCQWWTNGCLWAWLCKVCFPIITLYVLVCLDAFFHIVERSQIRPIILEGVFSAWTSLGICFKTKLQRWYHGQQREMDGEIEMWAGCKHTVQL